MYISEGIHKVKGVRLSKDELDYDSLMETGSLLEKLESIESLNSYVTDYFQNRLILVSDSFCRLVGYSKEEIREMGEGFYRKVFSEEDLKLHIQIAEAYVSFYRSLSLEDRPYYTTSYCFPFKRKDGRVLGLVRRTCALKMLPDGRVWLSLSCLDYSSSNRVGNVFSMLRNKKKSFSYSLETDKWTELEAVALTEKELFTAIGYMRGTCDKQIADVLCVSKDTISYYKKQIMQKTNTKSMREAMDFLLTHSMI